MAEARPVPTVIVSGGSARLREQAVAAALENNTMQDTAVLLEGLPDGQSPLQDRPGLLVTRNAAGCLCCTGNLVLRVTLNRLLRKRPSRLYIGLASAAHREALQAQLTTPPYDTLLHLEKEILLA